MVRFANINDLDAVNELRRQVHMFHYNHRKDIFNDFSNELKKYVYDNFKEKNFKIIVYDEQGIIKGYAILEKVFTNETAYIKQRKYLKVDEFGVDESSQRQGIGRELFNFIKDFANKEEISNIELSMFEFNEKALKFYESIGFKTYKRYLELK